MMEQSKTVILNILVVISLILTWLLLISEPNYDYLNPAQYVEPNSMGEKKQLNELVRPQSIVLHHGNQRYTGAMPDTIYYDLIRREMEKWYFFNFKKENVAKEKWNEIIHEKKAVEIIYPTDLPLEVMEEMFTFRGKANAMLPKANRILIYADEPEKATYAIFIDQAGEQMLQARTAITPVDLDQFYLSLGNSLPELMVFPIHDSSDLLPIYLPKESSVMKEFLYFYQPTPIVQIIQTLFVDPSLTRQVTERDGTAIYTDGSKAVQIPPDHHSIHYYDPMTDVTGTVSGSNINSVIQFINEHGGWNKNYMLESIKSQPEQEEVFLFRQHVGAYPIFGEKEKTLGSMEVKANGSFILEFHRSLINLDTYFNHKDTRIMSGQELVERLTELGVFMGEVEDIVLGYQAKINDHHLTLSPKWIIKLVGNDTVILDAKQMFKKEEPDGLEKSENHTHSRISAVG